VLSGKRYRQAYDDVLSSRTYRNKLIFLDLLYGSKKVRQTDPF
jgi:hypothetical protein